MIRMMIVPVYATLILLADVNIDSAIALAVAALVLLSSSTLAVMEARLVASDTKLVASTSAALARVFKPFIKPRRVSSSYSNITDVNTNRVSLPCLSCNSDSVYEHSCPSYPSLHRQVAAQVGSRTLQVSLLSSLLPVLTFIKTQLP